MRSAFVPPSSPRCRRREAGADLETRDGKQYAQLVDRFEVRQVALLLDEGRALDGATAEVVAEMRNQGRLPGRARTVASIGASRR